MSGPEPIGERRGHLHDSSTESREVSERWSGGEVAGVVVAMVFCALFGLVLGYLGARLSGLNLPSSGSFDLSPLLYFALGFIVGGGAFLVSLALFRRGELIARIGKAALLALVCSFLSGAVGHRIAKSDDARSKERYRKETKEPHGAPAPPSN